jgi:murein DD-endopeptidase MepM/ murein hydrolase activator NlpD
MLVRNIGKKIVATMIVVFFLLPVSGFAQSGSHLQVEIEDKQSQIDSLKKQIAVYQKNIRLKRSEASTLKNELEILDTSIAKTEVDIEATEIEVSQIQLETRATELEIIEKEDLIDRQKGNISNLIQQIHKNDNQGALKIFVLNESMSDYFAQVEHTKELQSELQNSLLSIKLEKRELVDNKEVLSAKQEELDKLQDDLVLTKAQLTGEIHYKDTVLSKTQSSEKKFQQLYQNAKKEQQEISADIFNLEKKAREELERNKQDKPELSDSTLSWPVPKNKITSGFHDPDYPYRYLFEHPAIDIRAGQSTQIKAPAEGYVLKVRDAGYGYSYVALIHANGLSTVYGHVSKIYVKADEYVGKGEVIALSGGMPGTLGAGNLSSGPHLHFEVRLNGIPVNPLNYLP